MEAQSKGDAVFYLEKEESINANSQSSFIACIQRWSAYIHGHLYTDAAFVNVHAIDLLQNTKISEPKAPDNLKLNFNLSGV